MPRGKKAEVGDTRTAPNGYHYTRTERGWRLTHHIIAEESLGRGLEASERAVFEDGDRTNLHPSNIVVKPKGRSSNEARRARLEARIEELQAELAELDREDKSL
jgi:hypothetical protein